MAFNASFSYHTYRTPVNKQMRIESMLSHGFSDWELILAEKAVAAHFTTDVYLSGRESDQIAQVEV